MKKLNRKKIFMLLLCLMGITAIKAQTCSSPNVLTMPPYNFSAVDSFYMQPCFLKFNALSNKEAVKMYIKNFHLYPNYDFKLYNDSCAHLSANLLSSTVTTFGDTALLSYNTFIPGRNYLIRIVNNNVSPPDTVSRYSVAAIASSSVPSSIGTCPSSVTPASCELVCNGNFESLITSTLNAGIGAGINTSQLGNANGWGNANDATCDLFWNSGNPVAGNGVPCNWFGTQNANTGGGYAGLITGSPTYDYGEYLETKLVSTMAAGITYQISMYVSRSDFQNGNINDIGIYLTNTLVAQPGVNHLTITPNAVFSATTILNDATNWQKVSFCYTATGNENYLTIGQTSTLVPSSITAPTSIGTCTAPGSLYIANNSAYLYIDDVSVTPITNTISVATGSCLNVPSSFSLANTCFTATAYDWNFGDGTTVLNAGLNPSHTYTATGTFTVVLTTTASCGSVLTITTSIATPTCIYCPSSSSNYAVFSGTAFPTTTITGLTYTAPIVFNNDVTIPTGISVTLSNAEYLFGPNVKLIVSNGAELKLRGSHLYACQANVWQGVVVQDGGKVSSSIGSPNHNMIEDATIAIDVSGHTTSTLTSILALNKITFNKNYTGVKIDNYQRSSGPYPFSVTECVFTSRSLTFTPTSWPSTSTSSPGLRYAASGTPTTGLTPPYPVQSAAISTLKYPYSSQTAVTGILINNSGVTSGSIYYDVTIGDASVDLAFNLFDDLIVGIDASNSNVSSINNAFQNTQSASCGRNCSYGSGIRSKVSTNLNAQLNLTASGTYSTNYSVGNRFWDCHRAVDATNIYRLDCNYATIRSTQTTTNATSSALLPGKFGITNSTNRFDHTIRYNNINNINNAISINLASGTYTYGASTYTGVLAGNIFVDYNYFGAQLTNTTTLGTAFVNNAVTFGSSSTAGWNYVGTVGLRIQANTFDRVWRGISVSAFAEPVFVQTNTVNLVNDATLSSTQYGINCGNVPYVSINTNTLNAVNTTNTLVTLVFVAASPTCAVTCNTLNTAYQGFVFDQNSSGSTWKGNSMTAHARGMSLTHTAVIGTQGGSGAPSDNKWNSAWSGSNNGTYVDGSSDAQYSKLWYKIASAYTPTNPGYVIATASYFNTSNTPTTTGAYSCGGGGGNRIIMPPRVIASQNAARTINAVDPMIYTSDNILYRFLANNDSLRNSDSAYINFYNDHAGTSMDMFNQTEKALSSGQLTQAQSLNNAVTSNNNAATNYKSYYTLYANYQSGNFSAADNTTLLGLAQLCPGTDGTIVYQARALYNLINGTVLTVNDNCIVAGDNGQANARIMNVAEVKNNWDVSVFPNPNNGEFNIVSKTESEALNITVSDITGKVIFKKTVNTSNFISNLDIAAKAGIYLITIKNNNNESITKKLVITD